MGILLNKCRGTKKEISMSKCKGGGKSGGCCKHCCKGKPCGDTCISKNKQCHIKVKGCACWRKGCGGDQAPNKEENQQPQEEEEEKTDDDAGGDEEPEEKTDEGGDEEPEEKTE